MYHYSNNHMQAFYHNEYPPCSFNDARQNPNAVIPSPSKQPEPYVTVEVPPVQAEEPPDPTRKGKARPGPGPVAGAGTKPGVVDTSTFSIEERLVAAVWVHERKRTRTSISQIKRDFRQRFGREPPAKNTLLVWERKLFASGSVSDAPRTGRPSNRSSHTERVAASLAAAPALSLRARAAALRLPRTTLRAILRHDLPGTKPAVKKGNKSVVKKGKVRVLKSVPAPAPAPPPPAPAPPPHARHYAATAAHSHINTYL